ncbi:MAG TPA: hypothetical protein VMS00_06705, partial [Acidimicrobiales bacterium]|nr:hypothetical protein [Acidimicrobiales bacterium]
MSRRSFMMGAGAIAAAGLSLRNVPGLTRGVLSPQAASTGPGTSKNIVTAGLYRDLDEQNFFRINDGVQYGSNLFGHEKANPLIYSNNSTTEEAVIAGQISSLGSGQLLA